MKIDTPTDKNTREWRQYFTKKTGDPLRSHGSSEELSGETRTLIIHIGIVEHTCIAGLKCRGSITGTTIILKIPTSATELHVRASRPLLVFFNEIPLPCLPSSADAPLQPNRISLSDPNPQSS